MPLPSLDRQVRPAEPGYPLEVWESRALPGSYVKLVEHRPDDQTKAWATRLLDRGTAARRVNHANVVKILDVGNDRGKTYVATESLAGKPNEADVAVLVLRGGMGVDRAVRIAWQAAVALVAAAEAGVVHGCIKPSKIMLMPHPWSADFDQVKLRDLAMGNLRLYLGRKAHNLPTAQYLAPELVTIGYEPDQRSDIYSLGVCFYQMLTGQLPVVGESIDEIHIKKYMQVAARRVIEYRPNLAAIHADRIEMVLAKMLAPRPQDRYQSAMELVEALRDLAASLGYALEPPPPTAPSQDEQKHEVWRDGAMVVMKRGAKLPKRCVRCNAAAEGPPIEQKLFWHPGGLYALLLVPCALLYLVVAAIVQKTAPLDVRLCRRHHASRSATLVQAWLLVIAGLGVLGGAYYFESLWMAVFGCVVIVAGAALGVFGAEVLAARRIDDKVLCLTGAGRAFLDSLPDPGAAINPNDGAAPEADAGRTVGRMTHAA